MVEGIGFDSLFLFLLVFSSSDLNWDWVCFPFSVWVLGLCFLIGCVCVCVRVFFFFCLFVGKTMGKKRSWVLGMGGFGFGGTVVLSSSESKWEIHRLRFF